MPERKISNPDAPITVKVPQRLSSKCGTAWHRSFLTLSIRKQRFELTFEQALTIRRHIHIMFSQLPELNLMDTHPCASLLQQNALETQDFKSALREADVNYLLQKMHVQI